MLNNILNVTSECKGEPGTIISISGEENLIIGSYDKGISVLKEGLTPDQNRILDICLRFIEEICNFFKTSWQTLNNDKTLHEAFTHILTTSPLQRELKSNMGIKNLSKFFSISSLLDNTTMEKFDLLVSFVPHIQALDTSCISCELFNSANFCNIRNNSQKQCLLNVKNSIVNLVRLCNYTVGLLLLQHLLLIKNFYKKSITSSQYRK